MRKMDLTAGRWNGGKAGQGKEKNYLPVMSAQDDLLAAQLSRELSNVVRHSLVPVVFQRVRRCILSNHT